MSSPVLIARLVGAFGTKGQVKLRSFTSPDDRCLHYGPLKDSKGLVRITPIQHRRQHNGYFVVTPSESRTREDWITLKGTDLFTSTDKLDPLKDGEFHAASLAGCSVVHVDGRKLGQVRAVHNFGAGDLLDVSCGSITYYLPFNDEIATEIHINERRIISHCHDHWLPPKLHK